MCVGGLSIWLRVLLLTGAALSGAHVLGAQVGSVIVRFVEVILLPFALLMEILKAVQHRVCLFLVFITCRKIFFKVNKRELHAVMLFYHFYSFLVGTLLAVVVFWFPIKSFSAWLWDCFGVWQDKPSEPKHFKTHSATLLSKVWCADDTKESAVFLSPLIMFGVWVESLKCGH